MQFNACTSVFEIKSSEMKIEAVIYLNTDMFVEAKGLNVATM
jgi:hypothetical protein